MPGKDASGRKARKGRLASARPVLRRNEWAAHPNYPSQVLLLGSHANFLRISSFLVGEVQGASDLNYAWELFTRWKAAMRSHEAYEEHKLYPFLAARWEADFSTARDGHRALELCEHAVRSAYTLAKAGDDGRGALADALEAHHRVLEEHLEFEEDLVIPLLLGLSPEEFRAYSRAPALRASAFP